MVDRLSSGNNVVAIMVLCPVARNHTLDPTDKEWFCNMDEDYRNSVKLGNDVRMVDEKKRVVYDGNIFFGVGWGLSLIQGLCMESLFEVSKKKKVHTFAQ
ncbi:hypothetical protein Tco_1383304 [Tanacetum coccineum]